MTDSPRGGGWATLKAWEIELGYYVGMHRSHFAVCERLQHLDKATSDFGGPNLHICGALGEIAVANYLNLYWSSGWGDLNAPDVGFCVEVRATNVIDGHLIITPRDVDQKIFVLARVCDVWLPRIQLPGWCRAVDGKKDEFRRAAPGRPAQFYVPQSQLEPIDALMVRITP